MPIATHPAKPRVFSLYYLDPELRAYAEDRFNLTCPGDKGWENWKEEAQAIMVRSEHITPEDTAQMGKQLKYVGKHGVGVNAVDVKGLRAKGIITMNTPGVNATAVAELALTLSLAVARNIAQIDRRIRDGQLVTKAEGGNGGIQLTGKTLGLIGGGNIGFALGKMFYGAFGAKVIVYDPYLSPAMEKSWNEAIPSGSFTKVSTIEELLPQIDVLSLHVPLLDSTVDLIGKDELALMKNSAIVINTARGGIVNEDALADALEAGEILGAGIDAWHVEPPTMKDSSRLISLPRVISLPHIGAASLDVIITTGKSVVDHLHEAFSGQEPRDEVKA